jgi:F1F0 ATPase subunit 2
MSLAIIGSPPAFAIPILIAVYLAAGVGIGVVFFRGLWWNARLIVNGGSVATSMFLLIGRFILMGGLLTLAALHGAAPLLGVALGVFVGRFLVVRDVRDGES